MQLEEGEIEEGSDDGLNPYTPLERPLLALNHEIREVSIEGSDKESIGGVETEGVMQLEEGEIEEGSDDGLNPYTPLERPLLALNHEIREVSIEGSDKESIGKYSSSDSDDEYCPKKAKMRRTIPLPKNPKRNKYTIWCKDPNDHLTGFLDSFGMRKPEDDRSVESYIVPSCEERKRKVPVRKSLLGSAELEPKILAELETSENDTFESLARDISKKLCEENYDLVLRIVVVGGKTLAIKLYNRTKDIERDGGLLIANGSRRRTSGGIFILLVRKDKTITADQKKEIFDDSNVNGKLSSKKAKKRERKRRYKSWLAKMNYEKDESGQEEPNNPPPSPEPHCPVPLPELRLRRELLSYGDLQASTDSEDEEEEAGKRELPPEESRSPGADSQRTPVDYDDLCSMELIYD